MNLKGCQDTCVNGRALSTETVPASTPSPRDAQRLVSQGNEVIVSDSTLLQSAILEAERLRRKEQGASLGIGRIKAPGFAMLPCNVRQIKASVCSSVSHLHNEEAGMFLKPNDHVFLEILHCY